MQLEITEWLFNNRSEFKLTYLRALKELEAKIADSSVSAKVYFVSKFSFKNIDFKIIFSDFKKVIISVISVTDFKLHFELPIVRVFKKKRYIFVYFNDANGCGCLF